MKITSNSPEQTFQIGKKIGAALRPGKVVRFIGNLGSGKTTIIKGIVAGTGVEKNDYVNSPTFVIVNEYQGRFDIFHIDAYRIESIAEFEALGFEDFIGPSSVVLVEWADKVADALKGLDCIDINMQHSGSQKPQSRIITINGIEIEE